MIELPKTESKLKFLIILYLILWGLIIFMSIGPRAFVLIDEGAHGGAGIFVSKYIKDLLNPFQKYDYKSDFIEYKSAASYYPPVYTVLTGIGYLLFGDNSVAPKLVNILLGILGLYYLFILVKKINSDKEAVIALILMSAAPIYFVFCKHIMLDISQAAMMIISSYYFLSYYRDKQSKYYYFCTALSLVILSLTRQTAVLVISPAVIIFLIYDYYSGRSNRDLQNMLKESVAFAVIPFAAIAGWYLFLYKHSSYNIIEDLVKYNEKNSLTLIQNLTYYIKSMKESFGIVNVGLVVPGIFIALYKRKKTDIFLLIVVIVNYLLFSYTSLKDKRFGLPLYYVLVMYASTAIISLSSFKIKSKKIQNTIIIVLLVLSIIYSLKAYKKYWVGWEGSQTGLYDIADDFISKSGRGENIYLSEEGDKYLLYIKDKDRKIKIHAGLGYDISVDASVEMLTNRLTGVNYVLATSITPEPIINVLKDGTQWEEIYNTSNNPADIKCSIYRNKRTFEAESLFIQQGGVVDDNNASGGRAVISAPKSNDNVNVIYGPYYYLPAGRYYLSARVKYLKGSDNFAEIRVTCDQNTIKSFSVYKNYYSGPDEYKDIVANFNLKSGGVIETPAFCNASSQFVIDYIRIYTEREYLDMYTSGIIRGNVNKYCFSRDKEPVQNVRIVDYSKNIWTDKTTPDKSIDGSLSTNWATGSFPAYIVYDLGNQYVIEDIVLSLYDAPGYLYNMSIYGFKNRDDKQVYKIAENKDMGASFSINVKIDETIRYIKLICNSSNKDGGISLNEVRFIHSME